MRVLLLLLLLLLLPLWLGQQLRKRRRWWRWKSAAHATCRHCWDARGYAPARTAARSAFMCLAMHPLRCTRGLRRPPLLQYCRAWAPHTPLLESWPQAAQARYPGQQQANGGADACLNLTEPDLPSLSGCVFEFKLMVVFS